MMEQEHGRIGKAGIPCADPIKPLWLDQRRIEFRMEFDNGPLIINAPRVLTPAELDDLDGYFSLIATSFHRRAQAIEARSAKTEGLGPKGESAVPTGDAPHA